jgi:polyhydroxyalkanoate synthesis regulator phasin
MKRIILASMLLATPAMAQQQPPTPPGQKALEIMLSRETTAHQSDLGAALQLSDQVDALKKQVADLTAENAKLKPPVAEPAAEPAK